MRTAARACGGLQGTARLGPSGNLAATLARHAAAQGAVNDEDHLEATAAPELQRRRSVTTRPVFGPHMTSFFLLLCNDQPIGWNLSMSLCRSAIWPTW